jgi:hypothetical protein
MKIYNKDGTFTFVNDSLVQVIESGKINKIVKSPTGVDLVMKDGSIQHLLNAKTDGMSVWWD